MGGSLKDSKGVPRGKGGGGGTGLCWFLGAFPLHFYQAGCFHSPESLRPRGGICTGTHSHGELEAGNKAGNEGIGALPACLSGPSRNPVARSLAPSLIGSCLTRPAKHKGGPIQHLVAAGGARAEAAELDGGR